MDNLRVTIQYTTDASGFDLVRQCVVDAIEAYKKHLLDPSSNVKSRAAVRAQLKKAENLLEGLT